METIYKIVGGGQRVQQNEQNGQPTEVIKVENCNYPDQAKAEGVNTFTGEMWSTDLETVQRWADEWVGKKAAIFVR